MDTNTQLSFYQRLHTIAWTIIACACFVAVFVVKLHLVTVGYDQDGYQAMLDSAPQQVAYADIPSPKKHGR